MEGSGRKMEGNETKSNQTQKEIKLTPPSILKHNLIIQPQPKLRHAREVALHLDCAEDLGADYVA